jgi:hypothetical protein
MTAMEAAEFFADLTYVLLIPVIVFACAAIGARVIGGKPTSDENDREWMWRIK